MRIKYVLLTAGISVLSACASQTETSPVATPPAPVTAPAAPAAPPAAPPAPAAAAPISIPTELPPGIGREAVLKGCGGCHGVGQILTERRSRQEWSDTVVNMITQGAPVSDAEFEPVVAYLATHFGPL